jgi:hypothetical protein
MDIARVNNATHPYSPEIKEFIYSVGRDYLMHGFTDKRCPICGAPMIRVGTDSSHTIKCTTPDCIENGFRGL